MADKKTNPYKKNPFKMPAFRKYMGVSFALIILILAFVLIVWAAGGRKLNLPDSFYLIQLEEPTDDAPVVVFETNMGTIKAILYPDEAPKYCEYFTSLVEAGYYDNTYICAVQDTAYALGGTKFSNPNVTESPESDMTQLEAEVSPNLWPFKGALASFVGTDGIWPFTKNLAGSSIIFVNDIDEAYMAPEALTRTWGEELGSAYAEKGGIPNFSQKYTIFGQIYDGWEVYDAIMNAEVLETLQPASDIVLERVYLSTYGEENNG